MSGGHPGHGYFDNDLPHWAIKEISEWREIARIMVEMGDCGCVSRAELRDSHECGEDSMCVFCQAAALLDRNAHHELY